MAYRRSILTRVSRLRQASHPSFSCTLHVDNEKSQSKNDDTPRLQNYNLLQRGYHSSMNGASPGINSLLLRQDCFSFSPVLGSLCLFRNYSSNASGGGSDKAEFLNDVTQILTENGVETVSQAPDIATAISQAPSVSEVAIAAADSFPPVAALQYIIDGVHSFTGLNWWASIVLTTLMIQGVTVPIQIDQLRTRFIFEKIKPQLKETRQRMQDMLTDLFAHLAAEGQQQQQLTDDLLKKIQQLNDLLKKHGITLFTPFKGDLIRVPVTISFFLAILNMAEKIPSFKQGGALWFTDLSTPDALYIFPIMTALTFLIRLECNPMGATATTFPRIIGFLLVLVTMSCPKAIFCFLVTSNLFSLAFRSVTRRPDVRKYLKLPEFPSPSKKKKD